MIISLNIIIHIILIIRTLSRRSARAWAPATCQEGPIANRRKKVSRVVASHQVLTVMCIMMNVDCYYCYDYDALVSKAGFITVGSEVSKVNQKLEWLPRIRCSGLVSKVGVIAKDTRHSVVSR